MNEEEREKLGFRIRMTVLATSIAVASFFGAKESSAQSYNDRENKSNTVRTTHGEQGLLDEMNNRNLSASDRVQAFGSCVDKGLIMPKYSENSDTKRNIEFVDKDGVLRATLTDGELKLHTYGTKYQRRSYDNPDNFFDFTYDNVKTTDVYMLPISSMGSGGTNYDADNARKISTLVEYKDGDRSGSTETIYNRVGGLASEQGIHQFKVAYPDGTSAVFVEKGYYSPKGGKSSLESTEEVTTYDNQDRKVSYEKIEKTPSRRVEQKSTYYPSGRLESFFSRDTEDGKETYMSYKCEDTPDSRITSIYSQGQKTSFEYGEEGFLSAVTYEKNGAEKVKIQVPVSQKLSGSCVFELSSLPYSKAADIASANDYVGTVVTYAAENGIQPVRSSCLYRQIIEKQQKAQQGNSQTGKALPSQQTTR